MRISAGNKIAGVSAVLITRGDVRLDRIQEALSVFPDVVIHDASVSPHGTRYQMYERYAQAWRAKNDVIYVQDDDCIVDVHAVVAAFEPGVVTCNMPKAKRAEYPEADGIALVGWGAVFNKALVRNFSRYFGSQPVDELFFREADRVFTAVNKVKLIDVPFEHLPWAHDKTRMGAQRYHLESLAEIRRRVKAI